MFNFYQNARLTKDRIRRGELEKCRLAFWLSVEHDGKLLPISPESLSNVITESELYIRHLSDERMVSSYRREMRTRIDDSASYRSDHPVTNKRTVTVSSVIVQAGVLLLTHEAHV